MTDLQHGEQNDDGFALVRAYQHRGLPIAVAARSKAWVCGLSLVGFVGSSPAGSMDVCLSVASVVCCQVEVSVTSWSLVQRSRTECLCVYRGTSGPQGTAKPCGGEGGTYTLGRLYVEWCLSSFRFRTVISVIAMTVCRVASRPSKRCALHSYCTTHALSWLAATVWRPSSISSRLSEFGSSMT